MMRINSIKDFRRMNSESNLQTLHFLKKACILPYKDPKTGKPRDTSQDDKPFLRGIMNFDDYNYSYFNQYVLVEDPKEPAANFGSASVSDNFSEVNMLQLEKHQYKHEAINLEKSEFELYKEREQELADKVQDAIENDQQKV